MMNKKVTKREKFEMVVAVVEASNVENKTELLEFLAHEVELLANKNSKSGLTKTQKANQELMVQLLEAFKEMEKPVTVTEFMNLSTHEVATLSNQKLSALLKKLTEGENAPMVKTVEKKKSYFSLK